MKSLPDLKEEKKLWQKKCLVIGVDEVGRGAIAGPVVAGAVAIFNFQFSISNENFKFQISNSKQDWLRLGIDDSKRLSPKRREELAKTIKKNALWGIGEASVAFINRKGIVKATEKAMRAALANLKLEIRNFKLQKNPQIFLLVDAFHVKYIPGVGLRNQKAIVKGDQKSVSIAAASVIAKVHRDDLMRRLHQKNRRYRPYRWDQNKGYGTDRHWKAIRKLGVSKPHRKKFVESGLTHK